MSICHILMVSLAVVDTVLLFQLVCAHHATTVAHVAAYVSPTHTRPFKKTHDNHIMIITQSIFLISVDLNIFILKR